MTLIGSDAASDRRGSELRRRILACLSKGEIRDEGGRATSILAKEIGYSGTTPAFAQLLAGMEKAGLIERQVKGKRTYLIRAKGSVEEAPQGSIRPLYAPELESQPKSKAPEQAGSQEGATSGIPAWLQDPDEAASSLLKALLRQLGAALGQEATPSPEPRQVAAPTRLLRQVHSLERQVSELERELARTRAERSRLAEENAELQARLEAAERNISLLERHSRPRMARAAANLDPDEVAILRSFIAPEGSKGR